MDFVFKTKIAKRSFSHHRSAEHSKTKYSQITKLPRTHREGKRKIASLTQIVHTQLQLSMSYNSIS